MKFKNHKQYSFVLFLILTFTSPVIAFAQSNNGLLLEFALSIQDQTSDIKLGSSSVYKTRTNQLGINWYEPFTHYFHGGLEFGLLEMTQADNTLPSAQFTSGEYAGLLLRFIPVFSDTLSLSLNMNYRYSQTRGSSTDQETEFAWYSTTLSTELEYRPTNQVGLILAAEFHTLDGEQRDSGTVAKITEIDTNEQESLRFGINFKSSRNGVIGIEETSGFNNGTRLYFLRKF